MQFPRQRVQIEVKPVPEMYMANDATGNKFPMRPLNRESPVDYLNFLLSAGEFLLFLQSPIDKPIT